MVLNHKNTPFTALKANSSEIIQLFFFSLQFKIYKHLFNYSYLVIIVSFPFIFHNLDFGKVCVEEKEQGSEV